MLKLHVCLVGVLGKLICCSTQLGPLRAMSLQPTNADVMFCDVLWEPRRCEKGGTAVRELDSLDVEPVSKLRSCTKEQKPRSILAILAT